MSNPIVVLIMQGDPRPCSLKKSESPALALSADKILPAPLLPTLPTRKLRTTHQLSTHANVAHLLQLNGIPYGGGVFDVPGFVFAALLSFGPALVPAWTSPGCELVLMTDER